MHDIVQSTYRNTYNQLLLAVIFLVGGIGLAACTDVTVDPRSEAASDVVFTEDETYESYLAKLYAGLNVTGQQGPAGDGDIGGIDEGFSQYMRLYWSLQVLSTDEAVIAWQDDGIDELNDHSWDPDNQFARAMYDRVFFQVAQANEFLRQSTDDVLDERNVGTEIREQIPQFRAEARFLRALSYWHGIDLFGDIPLVTEDFVRGGEAPEQSTREEIFNFVEQELLEIVGDVEGDNSEEVLPPVGEAQYGRADQGAAFMLLAKLYQNAEVYVGTERYADVVEYTSRIIDSRAYSLESEYHDLFLADNAFSDEFIFAIPHDGTNTQHFGGTTYIGNASLGSEAGDFNLEGWFGLRATSTTVDRYEADDNRPRFPNTPGNQFLQQNADGEQRTKQITDIPDYVGGGGYKVPKYQNVTSDGQPGADNVHSDVDYPKFRLADAYLMYAEAVERGGGGDPGQAVSLINELRDRAFDGDAGTIDEGDLSLDFILDERSRELLWEGQRRVDLIRFDQFTEGTWAWKGGEPEGRETEAFRNLYPLPATELRANPNLEQNDGY